MRELTRVLVTGGAGFIGSHVMNRLVGSGCEVIVVDNLSAGVLANIEGHVREGRVCFVRGDIRDLETVVLRLFNAYGPRQGFSEYSGVITQFVDCV